MFKTADNKDDVASNISNKTKTALTSVWVDGSWVNVSDTNQRNNMQDDLNKVGEQVEEQQAGIKTAQQAADNAFNQAQTANDALVNLQGGSTSTIADLANDILARVTKDDLISQINIASDNILIQSGKLYLDAASTVFGGTAFITDAMITSLNADKIVAGTIKGSLIEANSITADKMAANFFQVGLNNYGENIKIAPDSVQVYTPGVQEPTMVLTQDGLGFRDRTNAEQLGEIYGGPMYNNDVYYNGIQIGLFPNDDLFAISKVAEDNTTTPLFIWSESNKSDAHRIELGFNFNDFVTFNKPIVVLDKIYDKWGDKSFHLENYNSAGIALINDAGAGVCFGNDGHLYFLNKNKFVDSVKALNITGV